MFKSRLVTNSIRIVAILAFIWIVARNQNQQIVAVICLLVGVLGVEYIDDLAMIVVEKFRRMKKGGGFEFDEPVASDKPKDIDIKTIDFHRLVAAGKNYFAENFIKEAVECFEDALKIKPDDIGIRLILSYIYGEKIQDKTKAIHHCEKAIEIDPESISAHFNLAVYTNHLKGFKYSYPLYQKTEELIKKKDEESSELYGKLNIFIGHDSRDYNRLEEAKVRYEKAVSILKKLAEQGDQSSAFWLKDAEKNLKELLISIEKKKA